MTIKLRLNELLEARGMSTRDLAQKTGLAYNVAVQAPAKRAAERSAKDGRLQPRVRRPTQSMHLHQST